MELAYYPGCSLHASSQLYDIQSKMVFRKLGIELKEIEDWNCCGATSAGKTNDFLAVALPARNLGIADATGLSEIVIPCSSCYSRTLVSQKRLSGRSRAEGDHQRGTHQESQGKDQGIEHPRGAAAQGGVRGDCGKGHKETRRPEAGLLLWLPADPLPQRCTVPDDVENPQGMETVCKALGAEPIDWSYKTDCCGASASVNDADQSLLLMSRIFKDALARGANCFVTTCPLCQFNVDAYQDEVGEKYGINSRLPVYFITELIGVAMGMNPREMQVDRHFVDAMGLLKELKLI